jgi:hypothetical protein
VLSRMAGNNSKYEQKKLKILTFQVKSPIRAKIQIEDKSSG